MHDLS
ncbi:hypothetical protein D030_2172A, partial [Vibrio parahaemolyticus AQ3810]